MKKTLFMLSSLGFTFGAIGMVVSLIASFVESGSSASIWQAREGACLSIWLISFGISHFVQNAENVVQKALAAAPFAIGLYLAYLWNFGGTPSELLLKADTALSVLASIFVTLTVSVVVAGLAAARK